MILTLDVGNTSIQAGIFKNDKLVFQSRIKTIKKTTQETYRTFFSEIFGRNSISACIISSVVPELDELLLRVCKSYLKKPPLFASTTLKTGITNLTNTYSHLGADRLADIVAAINLFPGNTIVVDLGTASKFEVVSENREYLGGAIGPGIKTSFDALIKNASKLQMVKLTTPKKVIEGYTTQKHLSGGFIFGFASLVDGMIQKINKETGWKSSKVILTGGYSELILPHLKEEVVLFPNLTIYGLLELWKLNKEK